MGSITSLFYEVDKHETAAQRFPGFLMVILAIKSHGELSQGNMQSSTANMYMPISQVVQVTANMFDRLTLLADKWSNSTKGLIALAFRGRANQRRIYATLCSEFQQPIPKLPGSTMAEAVGSKSFVSVSPSWFTLR